MRKPQVPVCRESAQGGCGTPSPPFQPASLTMQRTCMRYGSSQHVQRVRCVLAQSTHSRQAQGVTQRTRTTASQASQAPPSSKHVRM